MPPNVNLKNQATVIKWAPDHTYTTLRKGTNSMVCYDRSGFPLQQPFSVECTMLGNLDRVKQNMTVEAMAGDRAKARRSSPSSRRTARASSRSSVRSSTTGRVLTRSARRGHMTIAVPGATTATLGLPDNGRGGGVWIMAAGTSTAHLMVPGE